MGKEQNLLNYILGLPKTQLNSIKGNPVKVLEQMDYFALNQERLMNVGKYKGAIICEKIQQRKPNVLIELGGYCGYSAICFAKEIVNNPNAKYYSFELNPEFANISRQLIDLAGLSHKVEIFTGEAAKSLAKFKTELDKQKYTGVDFVFIDHWKDKYVPDLRVLETLNLIKPGTLITADNIKSPGVPEYAEYVRLSPEERRNYHATVENISGRKFVGRWNLLYETETVDVDNPETGNLDAVEITQCVEYLNG